MRAEDARARLAEAVRQLGLQHTLTDRVIFKLAVALKFPLSPLNENKYRMLIRIGGELVFILAAEFEDKTDADLRALFTAISPALTYKHKSSRGTHAKELHSVWVYVEVEPPTRNLPNYGIFPLSGREGWPERFRQPVGLPPLWSCF